MLGNPVRYIDPDGRSAEEAPESTHLDEDGNLIAIVEDGDNGVYQHANGTTESDILANQYYGAANLGAAFPSGGGTKINDGVTVTSTKSGFLVNEDGTYTLPAGETPFELTETTLAGAGEGAVANMSEWQ